MSGAAWTIVRPVRQAIVGGIEGGYNWQRGSFVLGGEADIQLSGADDTISPFEFSNPWFGTVRGRAGVALNNVLLYGTGGLSYGDLRADSFNLTEIAYDRWLGRRRWRRSRLQPALVGEGGVALSRNCQTRPSR